MARKKVKLRARVEDNVLIFKSLEYLTHTLSKYFNGKDVDVTIEDKYKPRSTNQNALYWIWLQEIAEYTGYDTEDLHTIFKGRYGVKKIVKMGGKDIRIPKSTTEYTTAEFVEYMDRINAEAGDLGIRLPDPKDLENYIPNNTPYGEKI